MSRLILVSNRLPVTVARDEGGGVTVARSTGGLATGLSRPHEERGGLWLGWPGDVSQVAPSFRGELEEQLDALRCIPLYLSTGEVNRYYEGFSNRVLWPLFHSMPESVPMERRHFGTYRQVNQRFADAVVERWNPGDTIWVHDYQLLLVPSMIRRKLPDATIGFFLHIPFPPADLFSTLPWRHELLEGMLGADLIGFHTPAFARNFEGALRELLNVQINASQVKRPGGRVARIGAFPMGIDAASFEALSKDDAVLERAAAIRAHTRDHGQMLILGIDRMDYTKGISRRLVAVSRLLERKPELRGHVRFVQVAVPSRENVAAYEALRHEVEMLAGRINSQFGTVDSEPIHYLYRSCSPSELVALYSAADVMLVTPLRDGMNLVAKEFVASRTDDDGVLVLSEFAGAAAELREALIINPYDLEQVAAAIGRALEMPRAERAERMQALRRRVREADVHAWVSNFLGTLEAATRPAPAVNSTLDDLEQLEAELRDAPALTLLLDYDGTLVPLVQRPELAAPDAELIELLRQLASEPNTRVHIVSGRPREVLEEWLGALPIGLHAEHGLWSRPTPQDEWQMLENVSTRWKERVRPLLEAYAANAPGALIEEKSASLVWHHRQVAPELGIELTRALERELATLIHGDLSTDGLEVMPGDKVLEVHPRDIHKGRVVPAIMAGSPASLAVAFGDDRTDEDLFAALPEGGIAVHVGPQRSRAPIRIASPDQLRAFLWSLLAPSERTEAIEPSPGEPHP